MARRHGSVSDARRYRRPTGAARDAIGTERKHITWSRWRAGGQHSPHSPVLKFCAGRAISKIISRQRVVPGTDCSIACAGLSLFFPSVLL